MADPDDDASFDSTASPKTTRPEGGVGGGRRRFLGRIGSYDLRELLAEGGFGAVYSAVHCETGAPAAVKILHGDLAARPEVVLRFEREIDVIERIRHPNVIRIFEHGCHT